MKTEFDQQFSEGYFPGWPVSILILALLYIWLGIKGGGEGIQGFCLRFVLRKWLSFGGNEYTKDLKASISPVFALSVRACKLMRTLQASACVIPLSYFFDHQQLESK